MRIDGHQHFWKQDRGDYHWKNPNLPIFCRDFLPSDLQPSLEKNRIDKTVLVQAAPTKAETQFLLSLAQAHDFIAGVVGWLDLDDAGFAAELESCLARPKFLGVRPMLHNLPDDDWILRPRVIDSFKLLAERDIPFEFLTFPRHLPRVLRVLERVPRLRAVIDHLSKPEIKSRQFLPWRPLIAEVARHPSVTCKLSGMITEADREKWTPKDLRPYVEHVLECFGFERVIFGSDWPVCLLAGSYDQVIGALSAILKQVLDARREAAVFGGNAARFYKLFVRTSP